MSIVRSFHLSSHIRSTSPHLTRFHSICIKLSPWPGFYLPSFPTSRHQNLTIPSVAFVQSSCDPHSLPVISNLRDAILFGLNDYYGFRLFHLHCHFLGFDWDLLVWFPCVFFFLQDTIFDVLVYVSLL